MNYRYGERVIDYPPKFHHGRQVGGYRKFFEFFFEFFIISNLICAVHAGSPRQRKSRRTVPAFSDENMVKFPRFTPGPLGQVIHVALFLSL